MRKIVPLINADSFQKLSKQNVKMYGGSTWWILPDIVVDYIVDELQIGDTYISLLLDETYTPDETFFQTMTMRSPVHNLVEINPKGMIEQNCKTWAYFSDDEKRFKGHPYIFTRKEFQKLIDSDCWFARKFDMEVDSVVFNMIDEYCNR